MLVSTGTYGHIVANLASFELVHDGVGEGQKPVFVAIKQLASLDRYCNHGYGFMLCTTTVLGNIFLVLVYGAYWPKASSRMARKHALLFLAMALLMLVNPGNCGLAILANSSSGLVSDGVGEVQQSDFIVFEHWPSSDSYSQTIGFMPYTTTVPGNIFLILVFVSLMLFAAKLLYDGSEILVEVVSPRITGGVFLPLLGSLLDAIISFASRLCGNKETAQNDKVSAGIGLLTGSTAMLLMLLGGCCIMDGSAVGTDVRNSYTARIMVISVMPFIIIQLSQILNRTSPICLVALISLIISVSLLLAYCVYQVFHPSILKRRLAYTNAKHIMPRTVKNLKYCSLGRLLTANGEPDVEVIRRLFAMIGENSDQLLSASELRALITGIQIKEKDSAINDAVGEAKHSAICSSDNDLKTRLVVDHFNLATNKEHELPGVQSDEVAKIENPKWSVPKAVLMLLLGSLIAATFADPLVNALQRGSVSSNVCQPKEVEDYFFNIFKDIWSSEHEQAPLLVSLLRPALFSPFNMELHIRGADNSHYLELSSKANKMTYRKEKL
ncbi:Sodium/calcium exchanger NCL [Vitis vinifera]|uniref:Sodium/calcium exchanger NCL n=1 Tax=Vitis vinifera TaxID=29760 RepID=A0A438JK77_VITVI|nr:Sodium/calcium exchanger NCL [Vitis vinifera]